MQTKCTASWSAISCTGGNNSFFDPDGKQSVTQPQRLSKPVRYFWIMIIITRRNVPFNTSTKRMLHTLSFLSWSSIPLGAWCGVEAGAVIPTEDRLTLPPSWQIPPVAMETGSYLGGDAGRQTQEWTPRCPDWGDTSQGVLHIVRGKLALVGKTTVGSAYITQ